MKPKTKQSTTSPRRRPPAKTPEARENQLIALAVDLVEQRLLDGTATSQEVTHILKMGSTKAKLETETLRLQNELIRAKTENLQSQKKSEELYVKAMKAFSTYSGNRGGDDDPEIL